ncbi:polysaccharide biosynthesis C-terminal domain-containing protein [Pelagibacterium limicola]|uniref:oligosaccharide flippase family protein n=1 Tax=Pelagibacterium limicola TaxID=2791022 RepID=UPI0018AFED9B|nr:polysaccharide biosynthesis C-terminal domain-containing protein [Pelagibacterium limicola]
MIRTISARLATLVGTGGGQMSLSGFVVIAIRIGGAGLGLVAQVLASRLVGAEAFGYYALALVWLLLLGHGATAGTNQIVCRFLADYLTKGDRAAASGLLRFAFCMAGAAAVLVASISIAVVQTGVFDLEPATVLLFTLAFAVIPLLVLQDFLEAIARGLDKPNLGIAPALMLRHVAIIAGVLAMLAMGAGGDAITIMAMTVVGLAASVFVQYLLLRRHLSATLGGSRPEYRVGYWFRTALPIAFLDASEVLFHNADILVLGLFVPAETVAFYFAATRFAQVLSYVPYGMTAVSAQKYASLSAQQRHADLQRLIGQVTSVSTVATAIAGTVLWLMAVPLLTLFGPEYAAAAPVLPLLCLGIVIACALGPGEDVLTMLGQERICSVVVTLSLGLNVGLNFLLIPHWGMAGAALATAAAFAGRGMLLSYFAYRRLGLMLPLGTAAFGFKVPKEVQL